MDRQVSLVLRFDFTLGDDTTLFEVPDGELYQKIGDRLRDILMRQGATSVTHRLDFIGSEYGVKLELPADDEEDEDE